LDQNFFVYSAAALKEEFKALGADFEVKMRKDPEWQREGLNWANLIAGSKARLSATPLVDITAYHCRAEVVLCLRSAQAVARDHDRLSACRDEITELRSKAQQAIQDLKSHTSSIVSLEFSSYDTCVVSQYRPRRYTSGKNVGAKLRQPLHSLTSQSPVASSLVDRTLPWPSLQLPLVLLFESSHLPFLSLVD
jgi:hypothetical protein